MRKKGDIVIDPKRNLLYRVKEVRGKTLIIERVLPPSNALTDLDFLENSFGRSMPGLISLA